MYIVIPCISVFIDSGNFSFHFHFRDPHLSVLPNKAHGPVLAVSTPYLPPPPPPPGHSQPLPTTESPT